MCGIILLEAPQPQQLSDCGVKQAATAALETLSKLDQLYDRRVGVDGFTGGYGIVQVHQQAALPGVPVTMLALVHGINSLYGLLSPLFLDAV